ncbi:Rv3235 family protein [Corynebacterium sp.]|uniref:Rv3235 family protein n=1 Tax=Corynebacterium sp. TaxID=1720 RepID=UPI003B3A48A1
MGAVPGNTDDKTDAAPARTRYHAVPGLVYLRRPGPVERPVRSGTGAPATASPAEPGHTPDGVPDAAAVRARVAMLVGVWLEVLDGRRPVSVLRKGPFSPRVSEDLRGRLRDTRPLPGTPSTRTVSRVLSVHLPPTHPERLTFTASVAHGTRVRAVAGHLSRYDGRWRVETMNLI